MDDAAQANEGSPTVVSLNLGVCSCPQSAKTHHPGTLATGVQRVRQVLWCHAVQTLVNVNAQLVFDMVTDIQPMKILALDVRQTAVKLPCVGDDSCGKVNDMLELVCCRLWCASKQLQ